MNYSERDTILFVGPSASGKTEALNVARDIIGKAGIAHIYKPHSDSHTILDRMYEDDHNNHGRGHYHLWNKDKWNGHHHRNYDADKALPFTLTGNDVAHKFMYDFFSGLRDIPVTGPVRFAELSGGINVNDFDEPASKTDLSFATLNSLLRQGRFPKEGLLRVLAVIHPETDYEVRLSLNATRKIPTSEQIENGTASWPLSIEAMQIFGDDDFYELEPLLHEMGIPHIYTLPNDGGSLLREGIEARTPVILESRWSGERGMGNIREREL